MIHTIQTKDDFMNCSKYTENVLLHDIDLGVLKSPIHQIRGTFNGNGHVIKVRIHENDYKEPHQSLVSSIILAKISNLTIIYDELHIAQTSPTELDISLFALTIDSSHFENVKIICPLPKIHVSGYTFSGIAYSSSHSDYQNVQVILDHQEYDRWFEHSNHDTQN